MKRGFPSEPSTNHVRFRLAKMWRLLSMSFKGCQSWMIAPPGSWSLEDKSESKRRVLRASKSFTGTKGLLLLDSSDTISFSFRPETKLSKPSESPHRERTAWFINRKQRKKWLNVSGITITNHSFHVTSHPYRKAHLKSKTRLSSTDCQVFFSSSIQ